MIKSCMCVDPSEHCTVSSKHPVLGTLGLTTISPVWASPKVKRYANLYHILVEGKLLIVVLYVDNLILTGDEKLIRPCKDDLPREFETKDMGLMHYFLGLEVWQGDGE